MVDATTGRTIGGIKVNKPNIDKLPTSQMMAFCQFLGLPQGGDAETREAMVSNLKTVPDAKWADLEVKFPVAEV